MPHHTFHYPRNACQGPGQGGKPREEGRIHGRLTMRGHAGDATSSPRGLGRSFPLALTGSLSPAGAQPSAGCEEQRCHRQRQSPEQGRGAMPSFTPEKRLANTSLSPRSHGSANGCAEPRHGPAAPHSPPGGSRDLPGSPRQRIARGGGDLKAHPVPTPGAAAGPRAVPAGAATLGSPQ